MTDRYLQTWWRKAVLTANRNTCAICGQIKADESLECHHLIKRRYRVLRHDYRNGVPVCVGPCHQFADTSAGTHEIMMESKWGPYLVSTVKKYPTHKAYLQENGLSRDEAEASELDELKTVATGSTLEAS